MVKEDDPWNTVKISTVTSFAFDMLNESKDIGYSNQPVDSQSKWLPLGLLSETPLNLRHKCCEKTNSPWYDTTASCKSMDNLDSVFLRSAPLSKGGNCPHQNVKLSWRFNVSIGYHHVDWSADSHATRLSLRRVRRVLDAPQSWHSEAVQRKVQTCTTSSGGREFMEKCRVADAKCGVECSICHTFQGFATLEKRSGVIACPSSTAFPWSMR